MVKSRRKMLGWISIERFCQAEGGSGTECPCWKLKEA